MQLASGLAVVRVRADEARQRNLARIGEEQSDLHAHTHTKARYVCEARGIHAAPARMPYAFAHLGNAPHVLATVLGRKAEVLVESETDIVAIQAIAAEAGAQQVLLECAGERRLAGAA
jgi:hypothetical protein